MTEFSDAVDWDTVECDPGESDDYEESSGERLLGGRGLKISHKL